MSLDLGAKTTVHCSENKTTTFDIMDDTSPLENLEKKQDNMTKPVKPIMGRGMLWGREKRKEELSGRPEGPVTKRARMMESGLSEAKAIAKKDSADVINEFVDNIPDDGDEIRGMARVNRLLLEIRALVRKHQVDRLPDLLFLPNSASKQSFPKGLIIARLEIHLLMRRNPRKIQNMNE